MKRLLTNLALALAVTLPTAAFAGEKHSDAPERGSVGGVYTMDNSSGGNSVWAFGRRANGSLTAAKRYSTAGLGTGGGLGNQGGVLLSKDGRWLFACNAGSDEISVFAVTERGLVLTDKAASGGQRPISLALHRNLLYVLNAGGIVSGQDNVAGFLFIHGKLWPLPGATHPLSADSTDPAQVAFTQDGDHLVVTEKATANIDVFSLGCEGLISDVKAFTSPAPPPFGFAAGSHNRIFVTQAAGGGANPGASSVSSYEVTEDGGLVVISDSVATTQTAACWLILSKNEKFAYTANTPNDSISSFRVDRDGNLTLLAAQAGLTGSGSGPVDMAFSRDNRFLYSLNSGNGTIGNFNVNPRNGELTPASGAGVPTTANGLAAN